MDHLKTDQERKDRWYCSIVPEYISLKSISLEQMRENSGSNSNQCGFSEKPHVTGIPLGLLISNPKETTQFMKNYLSSHGFVVIQNVLQKSECEHALELAWDYIEAASIAEYCFQNQEHRNISKSPLLAPVRRGDHETYKSKYYPRSVEGNIFPYYGSGHSSFMWYIRSHPNIKHIFASLYDDSISDVSCNSLKNRDSMVSSLDGFILWTDMDNHKGKHSGAEQNEPDQGWFHIDQSPEKKPYFSSFQGMVNLLPVSPDFGGNVLVINSHDVFPDHYTKCENRNLFYKKRLKELDGDDWLEIDPNDELLLSRPVITCLLEPGDVLIWDSRTVHCSYREKTTKTDERRHYKDKRAFASQYGLVRAAALVNMIPRRQVSSEVLNERLDVVSKSRTLTHWVNKVTPLGDERVDEVSKETYCVKCMKLNSDVLLSLDDLSDNQRALL